MSLTLRPDVAEAIVWSARGTCDERGCTDPECCCALCLKPIGVSEEDPRWEQHSVWCDGCELCRDSVPIQLFRDEGEIVYQASFHQTCFGILIGPKRFGGLRRDG